MSDRKKLLQLAQRVVDAPPDTRPIEVWARDLAKQLGVLKD